MSYNRWGGDKVKLQEVRKAKGLTQAELALQSGVKLRTIQEYEYGRQKMDSAHIDTLVGIGEALEVPFYELMEDELRIEAIKNNIKRGL